MKKKLPLCFARFLCRFAVAIAMAVTVVFSVSQASAQSNDVILKQWVRYEIRNRLCDAGLPAPDPVSMANVPPRAEEMAIVREQLNAVDWRAAVRGGVQRAVIRGGNAMGSLSGGELREAVTDAVVESMNASAEQGDQATDFQRLVEEGVEDAMVQLLNAMGKQASDESADSATSPKAATPTTLPNSKPAKQNLIPVVQRPPMPAALAMHLPANHAEFFPTRYLRLREISGGWYRDRSGVWQPLLDSSAVLAIRREDDQRGDIWVQGRVAASNARYVTSYEETQ
ncbi:MAG: hypothetical protein NXI22_19495 [bacterium]|nr:hypothetical protein [bacterium]